MKTKKSPSKQELENKRISEKIIEIHKENKINGELVRETIKLIYRSIRCPSNVIMDRGSQYTAFGTRKFFDQYNWTESYSKKGCPFDNSVVEAFFKYFKRDEVYRCHYITKEQMVDSLFEYVNGHHNTRKKHSANGFIAPNKKEALYWQRLNPSENKNSNPKKQTAVGGTPDSCLHYQTSIN